MEATDTDRNGTIFQTHDGRQMKHTNNKPNTKKTAGKTKIRQSAVPSSQVGEWTYAGLVKFNTLLGKGNTKFSSKKIKFNWIKEKTKEKTGYDKIVGIKGRIRRYK